MMLSRGRNCLLGLSRSQKVAVMLAADVAALPACLMAAYYLRLGDSTLLHDYGVGAPIIVGLATIPVFHVCGLYRSVVRFVDVHLLWSTGIGLAALALAAYVLSWLLGDPLPPRSSLFIYWFIAFAYVVVSRFGARHLLRAPSDRVGPPPRVAIYGAGEAGFQLAEAMRTSRTYEPVCFVDDDPQVRDKQVAGLRVLSFARLCQRAPALGIEQVILAVPRATPADRRRLFDAVSAAGFTVRTLPTMSELADGKVSDTAVRDIDVADLLGRQPVPPDRALFARCVQDKTVLVTGAGGSIGSELCRQILTQRPQKLILLDHCEYALYEIEQELRERAPDAVIVAVLGSVCDGDLLGAMLRRQRVHTIYHAAAYKHVPLVEANLAEGVHNNVAGTWAVGLNAARHGVETCVLVSTDKAVRPTNAMGASKRVSELIFQALAQRTYASIVFSMVRFGNVLGSSGSVVPLFRRQIAQRGPITLTHPDIMRYFMLIPEAAQLVVQAGAMARRGEVFVLDMGEPVRVIDLARAMIKLSGLRERTADDPDGDIEIRITGLRPGEKLYEELLIAGELQPSEHPRILASRETMLPLAELEPLLEHLFAACKSGDDLAVRRALQRLVPEYAPYSLLPDRPRRQAPEAAPAAADAAGRTTRPAVAPVALDQAGVTARVAL